MKQHLWSVNVDRMKSFVICECMVGFTIEMIEGQDLIVVMWFSHRFIRSLLVDIHMESSA